MHISKVSTICCASTIETKLQISWLRLANATRRPIPRVYDSLFYGIMAFKFCVEAIRALIQAVEMMKEAGRFHSAAGYQKQIAEVYESDQIDIGKSLHHYEEAAELYSGEESGG
jgi:hypothetical protein